jgi:hypothetical protein
MWGGKMLLSGGFCGLNSFHKMELTCHQTESCACGQELDIWYIVWLIQNAFMFILFMSIYCYMRQTTPSRKTYKQANMRISLVLNPLALTVLGVGIYYLIMVYNNDHCAANSESFHKKVESSIITLCIVVVECLYISYELIEKTLVALRQTCKKRTDRVLENQYLDGETSCEGDDRLYELAWNNRNRIASERRAQANREPFEANRLFRNALH